MRLTSASVIPETVKLKTFLQWLDSLHLNTESRASSSGCDLLGVMHLELLHPAGVIESLAKILEWMPLLNELLTDAVPKGDSGVVWAGVNLLCADGGALSPVKEGPVKAVEFR